MFGTSRGAPATIDPSAPTPARSEPIVLGVIRSSVTSTDIGLAFGFNDAVGIAHEFLTREQQIVDMRLFEANDDRGDPCAKTDQDSRNNAEPGNLPEQGRKSVVQGKRGAVRVDSGGVRKFKKTNENSKS